MYGCGVQAIPRDTQGTYSLPNGTLVKSGDAVLVSQHNPAMQDMAQALTNSLSRDGRGGMTGPLSMGGNKVGGLAAGAADNDAATVAQLRTATKGDPGADTGSVGRFNQIPDMNIRAGTNRFQVDDGGFVLADTTLTDADVTAHPLAIVKTANGRYFRRDQRDIRVVMFGADNTSTSGAYDASRDSYQAIMAAVRYARRFRNNAQGSLSGLPDVIFDDGAYSVSQDIILDDGTIRFTGRSSGQFGAPRALLFFPVNKGGFQFYKSGDIRNPLHTPAGSGTTGADGSSIVGLAIQGGNGSGSDGSGAHDGVFFGCRGHVDQCLIYGFPRHQLCFIGDAGSGQGNANGWSVGRVRLANPNPAAGGKCFFTSGGDSNAGRADFVDAVNGDVYEGSFLGASSYGTIQIAGGKFLGVGSANQSSVEALYCEGGGGVSDWSGTGIWVTNIQAADGVKAGSGYAFMNSGARRYRVPVSVRSTTTAGRYIETTFAADPSAGFLRNMADSADTSAVPFQFQEVIGNGSLRISYNQRAIIYMTGLSPTETIGQFGTGVAQPYVFAPVVQAKFNVAGTAARREWIDTGPPTAGTFARGDYIRQSTPAVGQPKGWFCTAGGSPGTWVADSNL